MMKNLENTKDFTGITTEEFHILADYIKALYGIRLKEEKRSLVNGRLSAVIRKHQLSGFSEYFSYVKADTSGKAAIELINKLTTNHTFFMRESAHFSYFYEVVLPYLFANVSDYDLRIWSAGCSTGEEPYTLAMYLADFFGDRKGNWDTKVLATDLSTEALDKARKGRYKREEIDNLPPLWKQKYFSYPDFETAQILPLIYNEVIFRKFNLMEAVFPFKKRFHVIFCRNVMIYFDTRTKEELVDKLYQITEPGGYLFIGHSESLNRETTKYRYVMPSLYRKE
ncbi:MAG: chemotaxis protein methyltransferase CheR [Clostridiales bacterium]|nr:chemotaxis protein methyltransferase CheR [Clostridiales bacterium]